MAAMRGIAPQRELNLNFKVVKLLGKGSYGSVYQVQRLGDGKAYALKEMDVRTMNQAEREDSVNEVRLLASVAHPNVISYNEAFLDGNRLCIIMEYAPDGDLAKVIKKFTNMRRPMPEDLIWKYFIQVARGLSALHHMKILHRDIKPGNIMIMENDVAKIGDLGIAKLLRHTMAKTQIGTPHYMPPEIWRNKPYSFTSDSWAMGCLIYEMATLKVPFEARSMNELKTKVMKGYYPPLPSTYSVELRNLVTRCLDQNPDRRPTLDEMLCSDAVQSRAHLLADIDRNRPPPSAGSGLLNTIKVPRNFQMLKGKLPPAVYESDAQQMRGYGNDGDNSADMDEARDRLPELPGAKAMAGGYVRQAQPVQAKAIQAGGMYKDAPALSDAMMYPMKPNIAMQQKAMVAAELRAREMKEAREREEASAAAAAAARVHSPSEDTPEPKRRQDAGIPHLHLNEQHPHNQAKSPTYAVGVGPGGSPYGYGKPSYTPTGQQQPAASPSSYAPTVNGVSGGAPSPSAYDIIRKANQRGNYMNDDNSPWHYPGAKLPPKVAYAESESHSAYGAFYKQHPSPAPSRAPAAAAADLFSHFAPQPQQQRPPQQQAPAQAFQGYYNPYMPHGVNKGEHMYPPVPQKQKLPSLAEQRQIAAMERLCYGGRKAQREAVDRPAWGYNNGSPSGQQRGGWGGPAPSVAQGGGGGIKRYPPMQWQAPKPGRW